MYQNVECTKFSIHFTKSLSSTRRVAVVGTPCGQLYTYMYGTKFSTIYSTAESTEHTSQEHTALAHVCTVLLYKLFILGNKVPHTKVQHFLLAES
jgi:hypothetical protein